MIASSSFSMVSGVMSGSVGWPRWCLLMFTLNWVESAVAMGAGEICLTAHHEGGFCLWDTAYTNYSVMHSPYGRDVVAQFVASCNKYGVKPCFYNVAREYSQ